jgi:hypothetical protein
MLLETQGAPMAAAVLAAVRPVGLAQLQEPEQPVS